jgi:hypothetical protein
MIVRIVAAFPVHIPEFDALPGVRLRRHGDRTYTQVECEVTTTGEVTTARPKHAAPAGAPPPNFRIHVECDRGTQPGEGSVAVVIHPRDKDGPADPEQRIGAPFFNNGRKQIFEFLRGDVLHVTRTGLIEMRYIAVDRDSGQIGTVERFRLHARYLTLLGRCVAHLEGTTDLFPAQPRSERGTPRIPEGAANLSFGPPEARVSAPPPVADDER